MLVSVQLLIHYQGLQQYRRLFTKFNREVVCWIDRWHGMTMDDVRQFEEQTRRNLDQVQKFASNRNFCKISLGCVGLIFTCTAFPLWVIHSFLVADKLFLGSATGPGSGNATGTVDSSTPVFQKASNIFNSCLLCLIQSFASAIKIFKVCHVILCDFWYS